MTGPSVRDKVGSPMGRAKYLRRPVMNPIQQFDEAIRRRLPQCKTVIDEPLLETGCWWLDVVLDDERVVVQHLPNAYFLGLSKIIPDDAGFDAKPDEICGTIEAAVERAVQLLVPATPGVRSSDAQGETGSVQPRDGSSPSRRKEDSEPESHPDL